MDLYCQLLESFVQQVRHDMFMIRKIHKTAAFILISLGSLFGFVLGYFTHRFQARRQGVRAAASRQMSQQQKHAEAVDGHESKKTM
jgi:thiosulfate reductase cytochrome b subunit